MISLLQQEGGGIRGGGGEVWGGMIAPKFHCQYFDPTCAAGGSVSQGPVGAQRREAQPAGEAEKKRSVSFGTYL